MRAPANAFQKANDASGFDPGQQLEYVHHSSGSFKSPLVPRKDTRHRSVYALDGH
jgi:hypothetical protein